MINLSKKVSAHALCCLCLILSALVFQSVHAADPTAPTQLVSRNYASDSTEVFWERSSDDVLVIGYELTLNAARIGIFDTLSYLFDDLVPGRDYFLTVKAVDNEGNLSRATTTQFRAGDMRAPGSPASPTGISHVVYSRTAVEVFWDRVLSPVMSYIVYVDGRVRGFTDGVSHFIDGLSNNSTYNIEVVAVDPNNNESAAASVSVNTGTQNRLPAVPQSDPQNETQPPVTDRETFPTNSDVQPDRSVYQQNGYGTLDVIRVDLRTVTTPGTCTADDESGCTLADVLADTDKNDDHTVDIAVHFKSDDFADDGSFSNATLRQRGGGSRFGAQKSFRIKLDKIDGQDNLWRTERYLQLNKHPFESDRMRNKLAMDLMSRVPHLPSFRTQFVNLWIDDGNGPVDYGLYTHVERINDDYLSSRGLDKDGNLYKASDFRFSFTDLQHIEIDEDGKPINKDRFESKLEIEEGKDHRALRDMLSAIHDPQRSFQSVLDQYFNENNVMAWVATNLLLMQNDATRHNYILYNPSGTERFYFLPWDYDATMARWQLPADNSYSDQDLSARLAYGYALGAENVFVEQFYKLPGIHERLLTATKQLRSSYLDDATIVELSTQNAALIAPFQARLPDAEFNPAYNGVPSFAQNISWNADALAWRFNVPLPPTLLSPELVDDNWVFSWRPAYDPTENGVRYDLQIATSGDFAAGEIRVQIESIEDRNNMVVKRVSAAQLPAGTYYARVIARSLLEPQTYWTPARNRLLDGQTRRYGMIRFSTN